MGKSPQGGGVVVIFCKYIFYAHSILRNFSRPAWSVINRRRFLVSQLNKFGVPASVIWLAAISNNGMATFAIVDAQFYVSLDSPGSVISLNGLAVTFENSRLSVRIGLGDTHAKNNLLGCCSHAFRSCVGSSKDFWLTLGRARAA